MKALLIFTFILILPFMAICKEADTSFSFKFNKGIIIGTDFYFWHSRIPTTSPFVVPMVGIVTGVDIISLSKNRIEFNGAVKLSSRLEKLKKVELKSLIYDSTAPVSISGLYYDLFVEIPLKYNYFIKNKNPKIYISTGLSPDCQIFSASVNRLDYPDGTSKSQTGSSFRFNLIPVLTAGFGMEFYLKNGKNIRIEPEVRIPMSLLYGSNPFVWYSVGVNCVIFLDKKT